MQSYLFKFICSVFYNLLYFKGVNCLFDFDGIAMVCGISEFFNV